MKRTSSLLLVCFVSLLPVALKASPIQAETCVGPLQPVVGNHYSPRQTCQVSMEDQMHHKLTQIKDFYTAMRVKGKSGLTEYLPLGALTSMVSQAVSIVDKHVAHPLKTALICTACKSVVQSVQYGLQAGSSEEELLGMVQGLLCDYLQIISDEVCKEYLHVAGPSVLYILNNTVLSPEVVCSFIIPKTCDVDTPPELYWEVELPEPIAKTPLSRTAHLEGKQVLKVLHLSDTHIDDQYVEGSWDECGLPLCCRDPRPDNTSARAGKWGGWMCDIPERTLDSLLQFVVDDIKDIDHVFWTGDIPAHDLWGQSKERNLELISKTIDKISNYFPSESVVLPSIGNHEPVPGNLLPTPKVSTGKWSNDWLYGALADHWTTGTGWLSVDKAGTIKNGGYYKNAYRPGLVMISLNSVFCYSNNWWLILDSNDPGEELAWLIDQLAQAEYLGEKVHIMAHVPPGNEECLKVWQMNYYRIVERFQDTIVAQFFGHTHNEEFGLILNSDDTTKTTNVMFVGGSTTTYTYLNPGFRIYYIDGDHENTTRKVLDFETWIMDLEESNRIDEPVWKKLYSAKEAFGIDSLDAEEWRKVYERLKTDDEYLQQYHRFYWKDSPKRPECDEACRQTYLCSIVSCTQYGVGT